MRLIILQDRTYAIILTWQQLAHLLNGLLDFDEQDCSHEHLNNIHSSTPSLIIIRYLLGSSPFIGVLSPLSVVRCFISAVLHIIPQDQHNTSGFLPFNFLIYSISLLTLSQPRQMYTLRTVIYFFSEMCLDWLSCDNFPSNDCMSSSSCCLRDYRG